MLVTLAGCVAVYVQATRRQDRSVWSEYLSIGSDTRELIGEFRKVNIQPAAGSRILFLNDPFPNRWVTFFTASLVWKDPSLNIQLQQQSHLKPEEIERMDYIFDFVDNRLIVLRPLSAPL